MKKLHLGCGKRILKGWVNIDNQKGKGADLVHNLCKPLPYKNKSCEFIYSEHFIEHIDETQGYNLMVECYRLLCPGGWVRIVTPDIKQYVECYLDWENMKSTLPDPKAFKSGISFLNYATIGEAFKDNHQYLYDFNDLKNKMGEIGYIYIRECEQRVSKIESLCNLEEPTEYRIKAKVFVLEGMKPL